MQADGDDTEKEDQVLDAIEVISLVLKDPAEEVAAEEVTAEKKRKRRKVRMMCHVMCSDSPEPQGSGQPKHLLQTRRRMTLGVLVGELC